MIMRFKNKVITVLIIIAMLLVLVTVFLFCFYHITWKREIVGYALPPKDIETAKEKYGGTGDTPENAIDLPAREMTTIQVVKFPWDSNESYENKDKITQETLAIAIRYYYDFN